MLTTLAGGTISLLLLLGGCSAGGNDPAPHADITTTNTPDGKCHEDMPCWDCPTMGNHICGPDAPAWMQDGDPLTGPTCWDQPMPENASDEDAETAWVTECEG